MADISGSNTASSQIADGSDQITLMPNPLAQSERQEDRGRLWDDDLQRYVLQKVSMSSVGASLAPKVFMTPLAGTPERSVEGLSLEAGNKLGFNTYANSFFAGYWERYSTIRAVSLSGVMHGSGFLHLFKSTPSGDTQKIGKFPIGTLGQEDVFHIHFNLFEYLPSDGGAGRYYFDLEAGSDVVFKKIAFCAFDPARAQPYTFSGYLHIPQGRICHQAGTEPPSLSQGDLGHFDRRLFRQQRQGVFRSGQLERYCRSEPGFKSCRAGQYWWGGGICPQPA